MCYKDFDENYRVIRERIAAAAAKSGQSPEDITLLAATKTVSPELMNHAVLSGVTAIGENRVQEFLDKYPALRTDLCDCQFIGQLQTNKVKYIIDKVSLIQSVDSLKLAKEISRQAEKQRKVMGILVEVNIGREESKGGILPERLLGFLEEIQGFPWISVQGLMAIPPICENPVELCSYFSQMREYYVDITTKKLDNVSMRYLSMGMSEDYEAAISQGANMVRIGSALFGKRIYK